MPAIDWILYAVFAAPMFALLAAAATKVDGLVACPQRAARRRVLPAVDRNGFPMCVDPDGRLYRRLR